MNEVIRTEHLKKTYLLGTIKVEAVKDVSIVVKKGELISIMGASGSGKSTLMHLLGCLDTPTSGKYFLDGENVFSLNDNKIAEIRNKKIGFVFQTFNLLPHLNVLENVLLPVVYNPNGNTNGAKAKAIELLCSIGLGKRINHIPSQLSGGERQRVAIARALINDPVIILADEPTGNLDTKTGLGIIKILRELNEKRGVTEVIVTHDPYITQFTQRTIYISDGKIKGESINKNLMDPIKVSL